MNLCCLRTEELCISRKSGMITIKKLTAILTMSFCIVSCAQVDIRSPLLMGQLSDAGLRNQTDNDLCDAYAKELIKNERVKKELEARNKLSPQDWKAIRTGKLYVGMSELALICTWGLPGRYDHISVHEDGFNVRKTYSYQYFEDYPTVSIAKIQNGKVASWYDEPAEKDWLF